MINVLIFSDIRLYCEGLSEVLERDGTLNVISAICGTTELDALKVKFPPDITLLDVSSPIALQVLGIIRSRFKNSGVVALAVREQEVNLIECIRAGIISYVPREATLTDLIDAVIHARNGNVYCPSHITAGLFREITSNGPISPEVSLANVNDPLKSSAQLSSMRDTPSCTKQLTTFSMVVPEPLIASGPEHEAEKTHHVNPVSDQSNTKKVRLLTQREKEIALLVADGFPNKYIARELSIELSTVKNHVHNILVKIGARNRTQAASILHVSL